MLDEINYAIDQMNAVEGDWKTTLYNKNYESIETKNLEYTEQEKVLLRNIPRTTQFVFCVIRPVIHILIMKMVR